MVPCTGELEVAVLSFFFLAGADRSGLVFLKGGSVFSEGGYIFLGGGFVTTPPPPSDFDAPGVFDFGAYPSSAWTSCIALLPECSFLFFSTASVVSDLALSLRRFEARSSLEVELIVLPGLDKLSTTTLDEAGILAFLLAALSDRECGEATPMSTDVTSCLIAMFLPLVLCRSRFFFANFATLFTITGGSGNDLTLNSKPIYKALVRLV